MQFEDSPKEIPTSLPMLPVRDCVVFPYMIVPLSVSREASISAVEAAWSQNRIVFVATQKDIAEDNPTPESMHHVGIVGEIIRNRKRSDGRANIVIRGIAKAKITEFKHETPFFEVAVEKIDDKETTETPQHEVEALFRLAREQIDKIIALGRVFLHDIQVILDEVSDPGRFADIVASQVGLKLSDAQKILESDDPIARLKTVIAMLQNEAEVLQAQSRMRTSSKEDPNKAQRENLLREQMQAIKKELGDGDSKNEDLDDLRERIRNSGMPAAAETEALKQLARLERMHPDASEASMVRTYLDWLVDLPWNRKTTDNLDLNVAQQVLDEDHYDLEKVKDRIIEFLAVRKLKSDMKGPILCFVGPPGVGKTSLGRSIARAMGREYFRVALGGVKDEAEIRGHRRTYVGAMPGKIVQALRFVKTKNPVFVLDEIDKLGSDFRGDPSAAMLEVLDPEQNSTFRDNYLNLDFDLSDVLFIATANVQETIPAPLRDRMEIINLSGYTASDKLMIARRHLIQRQIQNNGITEKNIEFTDDGIAYLISHYTKEAGLRNLEREIASICRKIAKRVVLKEADFMRIEADDVTKLLGPPHYIRDERLDQPVVGVATGLAWTQAGGEVLFVEALSMKGKGGMVLTGQLGDVMKESAQAAMSYARAHSDHLGIPSDYFEKHEIHVHLPAGAIPKDGPSAGVTIATALISLMTNREVRNDIAMTGELTLQGRVLPVGGIREKCLAALSQGITRVVLPEANKKDLADIPSEFKESLQFHFVDHVENALKVALKGQPSNPTTQPDDSPTSSAA